MFSGNIVLPFANTNHAKGPWPCSRRAFTTVVGVTGGRATGKIHGTVAAPGASMGAGPTVQPGNATPAPDNVGPGNVGEGDDGGKDDKDDDDNDDNDRGGNDEGDEIGAVPATADGTNGDAGNDLVKNGGAVNAERAPFCGQHNAIRTQTYFKRMRLPDYNNVSQKQKNTFNHQNVFETY